jgi:hypothetical protein
MKELWARTFETFRRHLILWVPCSAAGVLMLVLGSLQKAEIHWALRHFTTRHSVLGGEVPAYDFNQAQHKAWMIVFPLGLLKDFLEVCLFVVALVMTAKLVGMILEEQRPELIAAVRGTASRWRGILLFSFKYMVIQGLLVEVPLFLGATLLTSARFSEFALSKSLVFTFGLVAEGVLAWLLVPAAIRLSGPEDSPIVASECRKVGVVFAVVTSAASLALGYGIDQAEATIVLDNQWELWSLRVVNTILVNAPDILLFIALALMAVQGADSAERLKDPGPDLLPPEPTAE